jgi:hypothetical protein
MTGLDKLTDPMQPLSDRLLVAFAGAVPIAAAVHVAWMTVDARASSHVPRRAHACGDVAAPSDVSEQARAIDRNWTLGSSLGGRPWAPASQRD